MTRAERDALRALLAKAGTPGGMPLAGITNLMVAVPKLLDQVDEGDRLLSRATEEAQEIISKGAAERDALKAEAERLNESLEAKSDHHSGGIDGNMRPCPCDSCQHVRRADLERDRALAGERDFKRRWYAVQDESNEKSERIAALEAALRKYGRHLRHEGDRETCPSVRGCICGLDAALAGGG